MTNPGLVLLILTHTVIPTTITIDTTVTIRATAIERKGLEECRACSGRTRKLCF
jgi:hypothetical protein